MNELGKSTKLGISSAPLLVERRWELRKKQSFSVNQKHWYLGAADSERPAILCRRVEALDSKGIVGS